MEHNNTAITPQPSAEALRLSAALEAGVCFEAQPYLCPECKQSFASTKKLNGHISGHKQKICGLLINMEIGKVRIASERNYIKNKTYVFSIELTSFRYFQYQINDLVLAAFPRLK